MLNLQRIAIVMIILVTSGCRLGNYTEKPKTFSYKRLVLGLEAERFSTYVLYNDGSNPTQNVNTPLVAIPDSVNQTFTVPISLIIPEEPGSIPFFYSDYGYTLGTSLNSAFEISNEAQTSVVTLWKNVNCKTQVQYLQDGVIDRSVKENYVDSAGVTRTTDGRLALDLTVMRVIEGDCVADLQELAACYQTPSSCPSGSVDAANNLYNIYEAYGGILNLNDVAKINALAYTVHFR